MKNNIKRRAILSGISGIAASGLFIPQAFNQVKLHIGVVGGGIVGASIALHLAAKGAKVTLFEKDKLASGATGNSFAWINGANTNDEYRNLRLRSLDVWRQLDNEFKLGIVWGGAIKWQPPGDAAGRVRADIEKMKDTDYPFKEINTEQFAKRAPEFIPGEIAIAGYSLTGGHLDPVKVTHKLIEQAKKLGVEVKMPCSVSGLIMSGGKLKGVHTNLGDMALDRIVVASGVDTPLLTSQVDYKPILKHEPGILVHTSKVDVATDKVVYGPGVHFKQFPNGRIVGADSETPPKSIAHNLINKGATLFPNKAIENMHSQRIIDKISSFLPVAEQASPMRLTLGFRPMPADRYPIVGYVPGSSSVYVAVMHSGVTLAPIMGKLIAWEIMDGLVDKGLNAFRPDRDGLI